MGRGILRLKDNRAWTILTAAQALKGFEEKFGRTRDKGVEHGIHRIARPGSSVERRKKRRSATRSSRIA